MRLRFSLKRLVLSMSLVCAALWILICFDRVLPSETHSPAIFLPAFLGLWGLCGTLIAVAILNLFARTEK